MEKVNILLLSIFLISGCVSQKKCLRKFPPQITTETKDSIIYRDSLVIQDTTIYVHILGNSIIDSIFIEVPKDIPIPKDTAKAEVEFAYALAYINPRWNVELQLHQKDTLLKIIEYLKKESWHWEKKYRTEKKVLVQKEKYIPKIYKWVFWIIIIEFALLIGYFIKKFGLLKIFK